MDIHLHKNILIIDDSHFILSVIEKALLKELSEVSIHKASSYAQAQELLEQIFFHAAIVDVVLPDAPDGAAIDLAISFDVPTIVLTGNADEEMQTHILTKSIFDFILKNNPDNINYVVFAIKRILNNHSTNVLVVDDSKSTRTMVARLLKKLHLNVFEAEHPLEAFEILNEPCLKISMVVTDYEMPHMNGLQFTLKLRQTYRKDILSIIALSAADQKGLSAKFLKHGASDFLQKPFDQEDLYVRINSNLELLDLFEDERIMSVQDPLTKIYNRRYFYEHLAGYLSKKPETVALGLVAIDYLDAINLEYGFKIGDALIKEVVDKMNTNLSEIKLIGRLSGNMYALYDESLCEENFLLKMEAIRVDIEKTRFDFKGEMLACTLSIGVYIGEVIELGAMIDLAEKIFNKLKSAVKTKWFIMFLVPSVTILFYCSKKAEHQ